MLHVVEKNQAPERTVECSPELRQALIKLLPNLRAFSISLCGDHDRADDLVQDTLLRAWRNLDKYQEGTNLRAWLFTILRNTHFSNFRKHRREIEDSEGKMAAGLAVLPEQESHSDMEDFRRALGKLPEDQREALILIGAAGFSYEEAASICDCAVGTIKSRVNRARARLASLMSVESCDDYWAAPEFQTIVVAGGRRAAF